MLIAVPCSAADAVALYDAADGNDAGRIAVGSHPVHLAAADGRVLVATMDERSVDVVAEGTVHRVPTDVLGPSHFAVVDDRAFVPCTGGDAVAVLDFDTLELRDRVAVGAEPHDAEVVGDAVYVGGRVDGTVSVIDARTAAERATVSVAERSDSGARVQGLTATGDRVYAVDQSNGCVVLLDETGVVAAAPVGTNPYEAVITDGRVLVAGRDDGTVTALSADLAEVTTHAVGGRPLDVVLANDDAWVVDRENAILRTLAGERVPLPHLGFAAVRDPRDSQRVYVSHYDDDALTAVDLADRSVAWTAETPGRPFDPLVV